MKNLILKVKSKKQIDRLKEFCQIVYCSQLLNVICIEIEEGLIYKIESDENIISWRESEEGTFQPNELSYC